MKSSLTLRIEFTIVAAFLSFVSAAVAQPAANPLDIHGLDQFSFVGIRSRGMGGTGIANALDAAALFSNPAGLARLSSIEVRAGGLLGKTFRQQSQHWVPERPLPGLALMFEGLTGRVKTPTDTSGMPLDPWATVQRQYDDIRPDWNTSASIAQPLSMVGAMPLTVAGLSFVAALGVSQAINLDSYYQNNNSMSPYPGHLRPYPVLFTQRTDTVHIKWYQYIRQREGVVYGITPGFALSVLPGLTIGASAAILTGSSDDNEHRVERGHVNISISNGSPDNFMLDTVYYRQSKSGTSSYTGTAITIGALYQQERFSIGFTLKPPVTITRTWDRMVTSLDTTKKSFPVRIDSQTARSYQESGTDKLRFPMIYSIGIVLTPTDQWTIAFDYEVKNLALMEFTSSSSTTSSNPWVNNKGEMRIGAEYRPDDLLSVRAGYREDKQAFSPDGSAIIDEPARGAVYSLGAGLNFGNVILDFGYEYAVLKYEDLYQSNVSYNLRERHQLLVGVAYRF